MRKSILILIFLMLPIIIEFADISYGSVVPQTSYQMRVLLLKERILTPDIQIVDDRDVVRIATPRVPLGSGISQIDYNFVEDMKYEKQYLRHLYSLMDR